jgi:hypothetical protein
MGCDIRLGVCIAVNKRAEEKNIFTVNWTVQFRFPKENISLVGRRYGPAN